MFCFDINTIQTATLLLPRPLSRVTPLLPEHNYTFFRIPTVKLIKLVIHLTEVKVKRQV